VAGGLAALSMSGLPPFFGFIGKELIYKAGVALNGLELGFLVAALVGNLVMMGLALKAGIGPFFGKPDYEALPKKPHEAPFAMWIGPIVLAVAGLVIGIFPFWVTDYMVIPAVAAIKATEVVHLDLALWNLVKPNLPLLLSGITVLGGVFVFLNRARFWAVSERVLSAVRPYGAEALYERIFNGTIWLSKVQTRALQTGRLHDYMFVIIGVTSALVAWTLILIAPTVGPIEFGDFNPMITVLLLIIIAATGLVVISDKYFTILGGLGTIGFGVALLYAFYGAPDLAITQLMAEALVVVLFMFVIYGLPPIRRFSGAATYQRDALLSIGFGLIVATLAWLAVGLQLDQPISAELAAMSYPEGKGRNVVNVILVDFRALDTFGEITVVAAAALGIAALLSSRLSRRRKEEGVEE
jgi:multicomponent Na+:H+ antiporter subunit A